MRVPNSHGRLPTWQRCWGLVRKTVCSTVYFSTVAPLAMASAAQAAQRPNQRVRDILDYISKHSQAALQGIPMEYEKQPYDGNVPSAVRGLQPGDVLPSSTAGPATLHMDRVVAALLFLRCGGLDEAHNLVTPLCWGSYTSYGGAPVTGSPAAKDAAYVHALVHLREGPLMGEFGSGFSNANYWYAAAGGHAIHPALLQQARQLASGSPRLERYIANHGQSWSAAKFVSLCQQASDSKDVELVGFCQKVMAAEWRLLLDSCLAKL